MANDIRIKESIGRINRATLGPDDKARVSREDITDLFHANVVFVSPDFSVRVEGREACLGTYAEFAAAAAAIDFKPGEPDVTVTGDTAVATTPFEIGYEMDGARTRESGRDVMVFTRDAGEWTVVWRMVIVLSHSTGGG